MTRARFSRESLLSSQALLIYLVLFKLLLHLLVNGQYGFFRDELSYIDDGKYLAWGYVDHPPLSGLLAATARALFGEQSLSGLRLFSALASAAVVLLTGLIVHELGGGRFAVLIAALSAMIAPMFLISGVLFQAVPFDQLWWVLAAYLFVRLMNSDNPRYWVGIGLVIGLGMMTKYTMLFFTVSFGIGVLLTQARRWLLNPWVIVGAAAAFLIFLPNLIWLAQHDWISLEYTRAINARDTAIGRTDDFLPEQLLLMHPFTLPIWIAGLFFFLRSNAGARWRALGWLYIAALVLFMLLQGRPYYLSPAYPMLFAGGAVLLERLTRQRSRLRAGLAAALLIGGVVFAPLSLPITPVATSLWQTASDLNDTFPEMIGWEELVATTAEIYQALPPAVQAQTAILTGNYGEAGAINLYGAAHGLPEAISPVNSYFYRSQGRLDADTYIVLGVERGELENWCGSLREAGRITNRYNIANEETTYHPTIYLCSALRIPLSSIWAEVQRFG